MIVADFCRHDNHSRPHGKLGGYIRPGRFAAQNPRPPSFVEAGHHHRSQLQTNPPADSLAKWLEKVGLVKPKSLRNQFIFKRYDA